MSQSVLDFLRAHSRYEESRLNGKAPVIGPPPASLWTVEQGCPEEPGRSKGHASLQFFSAMLWGLWLGPGCGEQNHRDQRPFMWWPSIMFLAPALHGHCPLLTIKGCG